MMKLKIGALVAAFLVLMSGLSYWLGDMKGYNRAIRDMAAAGVQVSAKAKKDQEKITHEERNMDDAAIDRGLREFGIMRPANHR